MFSLNIVNPITYPFTYCINKLKSFGIVFQADALDDYYPDEQVRENIKKDLKRIKKKYKKATHDVQITNNSLLCGSATGFALIMYIGITPLSIIPTITTLSLSSYLTKNIVHPLQEQEKEEITSVLMQYAPTKNLDTIKEEESTHTETNMSQEMSLDLINLLSIDSIYQLFLFDKSEMYELKIT